eukprot:8945169-Pyramimonas_sp.AAC.1
MSLVVACTQGLMACLHAKHSMLMSASRCDGSGDWISACMSMIACRTWLMFATALDLGSAGVASRAARAMICQPLAWITSHMSMTRLQHA